MLIGLYIADDLFGATVMETACPKAKKYLLSFTEKNCQLLKIWNQEPGPGIAMCLTKHFVS